MKVEKEASNDTREAEQCFPMEINVESEVNKLNSIQYENKQQSETSEIKKEQLRDTKYLKSTEVQTEIMPYSNDVLFCTNEIFTRKMKPIEIENILHFLYSQNSMKVNEISYQIPDNKIICCNCYNVLENSQLENLLISEKDIKLDYNLDDFSDLDIKHEPFTMDTFDNFETIEMLHDINNLIAFEANESSNIVSPLISDLDAQENNQHINNESNDPDTDPLYIDNRIKDPALENIKSSMENKNKRKSTKSKSSGNKSKRKFIKIFDKSNSNENLGYLKNSLNGSILTEEESEIQEEIELAIQKYDMSQSDIKRLQKLEICLICEPPPQHNIDGSGGILKSSIIPNNLNSFGPMRNGAYSSSEDEIITKNWILFCKIHHWDVKNVQPFMSFRLRNNEYILKREERKKFLQFIANGLPWRTLSSVYFRFRNLYSNHRVYKRYTSEDDRKILLHMQNISADSKRGHQKFSELAKLFNRTRHSVLCRYKKLISQNDLDDKPLIEVDWNLNKLREYIEHLLQLTMSNDIRELKNAIIPKIIWQEMEERMNINQNVLKNLWNLQLHMQLFCAEPIYLNDVKIMIIEYFYVKGVSQIREISWSNLAKHFDGMTSIFLSNTFHRIVRDCPIQPHNGEILDTIEYMYENKIQQLKNEKTDRFMPRLVYHNKILEMEEQP